MGIEYLGLSSIKGPLVILEGVQDAFFDEIVEFTVDGKTKKIGRIIELYEDKAVIQVFEGTENMSLDNTRTKLTGHPMEVSLAPDMLGRTFNGIGKPIDGLGPLITDVKRDVNGLPLNPVRRKYPRNYIRTGISAIDGLTTLIRGQKLPIFSGNGLPHDQLAAQIVKQASLGDGSDEPFAVVFGAMGVKHDVADFFQKTFEESGVANHVCMFLNLANDPVVERLITPKVALTAAEYFLLLANGKDGTEPVSRKKRWLALGLLIFMIVGATIGELPVVKEAFPEIRLDMFFFVCITTIIMAWTKIFPPKKYTKYISWDILITIACAFAISKAMENSGFAALIARHIIGMSSSMGPYALLAIVFIITNIFTELITNNVIR